MNWFQAFMDFILHIDDHLLLMVQTYGMWTYAILFAIIFVETGLVVMPFLPGDSLLFAAGALSATGALNPFLVFILLFIAAVIGDSVNYSLGSYFGTKVFKKDSRIFKLEYLHKTEEFFEKYGGKTIFLARFVPIVRTYAPFVAGASNMHYSRFILYNVVGAAVWTGVFISIGYLFGNIPVIQDNFSLAVIGIIVLSLVPILIEFFKAKRKKRTA